MAQTPKFDGSTSWAMFQRHSETMVGHNGWTPGDKATYLIAALNEPAANILHGIPTGVTYEAITVMLENHYSDHHLAETFHTQLRRRVQHSRESAGILLLPYTTWPTVPMLPQPDNTSVGKLPMHLLTGYKKEI
jgi:hypothetical protein